ncbi:protein amnionless-like [Oscarella lobularis]|uniref:protein amnionless-like n=1 Tax=Oscarella lobularis TaxID=121494 RepID=UPI003313D1BC
MFARLLILASALAASESALKEWTSNTNWNNEKNWSPGAIPCSADTVEFNDNASPYNVLIEDDVVIKELILSPSSEIVFDDGVTMSFANDTQCDTTVRFQRTKRAGRTTNFTGGDPKDWNDSDNWSPVNDDVADTPPCVYDDVLFPAETYFSVALDSSVTVKSFQLEGSSMSTNTFQAYLSTPDGARQFFFTNGATVTISKPNCEGNCPCGNGIVMTSPSPELPSLKPTEPQLSTSEPAGVVIESKGDNNNNNMYIIIGSVAGALVIILVVIIVVLAITHRRGMKRIRGAYENDATMAVTFNATDQSAALAGFSNPMYKTEGGITNNPIYGEMGGGEGRGDVGVSKVNPLFSSTDQVDDVAYDELTYQQLDPNQENPHYDSPK